MLNVDDLSLTLAGRVIFENISFQLQPGTILAILGSNGSGKSSLLKSLVGIHEEAQGSIFWQGISLRGMDRKERARILAYVPPITAAPTIELSLREFITFGFYAMEEKKEDEKELLIEKVAQKVEIHHLLDQPMRLLSSGERQKGYLARAFCNEGPILILDEPTSHLDLEQKIFFEELFTDLRDKQKILLIAMHDLGQAEKLGDQLLLLKNGIGTLLDNKERKIPDKLLQTHFSLVRSEWGDDRFDRIPPHINDNYPFATLQSTQ